MTDMAEVYDDGGAGPRLVIRLSRTTQGVRTYTVGASLPFTADARLDADVVARVFAVEDMVRMLVDGVVPAVAQPTPVELPEGKWYTMPELMARVGVPRGTLRRRLDKMRRMGAVEYRPGTGRAHPAQYRMRVVEGGKA